MSFAFSVASPARKEDIEFVRRNLIDYNLSRTTAGKDWTDLSVVARDDGGTPVGGVIAQLHWGWLHIDLLWVAEDRRGLGLGTALMDRVEGAAVDAGVDRAHTTTASFQARPFYEKRGYQVFGVLEDKPPGHSMYYLKKEGLARR